MDKKLRGLFEAIGVIIVSIYFSYVVQNNFSYFEKFIVKGVTGIVVYVLIEITSIVIAPVTTLPLIAVASNLWGWINAGLISIFAWTIGAWIAFVISRKYGVRIIKKFISIEKIQEIEAKIPREHLFWSVVLMRIIIPVDILSYALGIFTKMKARSYIIATIIGISPFAFLLAYLGTIPINYQILLFFIAGVLILIGWIIKLIYKKR